MSIVQKTPYGKRVTGEVQSAFGYKRRQKWTDPIAASATRIKALTATSNSVVTNFTTFAAQPDFARFVSITPGGTTTDVAAGDYVITGTNIRDEVITDTLVFAANDSAAQISVKAFKTVTNVLLPVQDGAGATFSVGVTDALGLDRCMEGNEVELVTLDGVYETTRPTVTFHATDISKNTIDPNTALNAAKDVVAIFTTIEKTNRGKGSL